MKGVYLALLLVFCSLFVSCGGKNDNLPQLVESWRLYDKALVEFESSQDADLQTKAAAQEALKNAKSQFIKNLCVEKESDFFRLENFFFQIQTKYYDLLVAVHNDDRLAVAKGVADYIYIRNEMSRNSSGVYAALLVLLSLMMAFMIVFIVFYQKTFSRAKENETTLQITMDAQETERKRLSQELHDSVAQEMRYVSMLADNIPENSVERQIATEIKSRQKKCIEDIRAICYNLFPIDIERKNLGGALAFLCQDFMQKSGIATKLTITEDADFSGFSKVQMHNIFRIVQELLSNIKKHAAANEVTVLARNATERDGNKEGVCIFVSDDGNGTFKNVQKNDGGAHFGLRSINARLNSLGATIDYNGIEGQGTDVKMYIPITGGGVLKNGFHNRRRP